MPVHRSLDDELKELDDLLVRMFDHVENQVTDTVKLLFGPDDDLRTKIRQRERKVDALELAIDGECERILALNHPVAGELRLIIVAVKINTDLERISDHCDNIARKGPNMVHHAGALDNTRFDDMAELTLEMLRETKQAFFDRRRALAETILEKDDTVDEYHRQNFKALVEFGHENPSTMEFIAHLIAVSQSLERISDHATNIAQSVIFLIEAVDVRHSGLH
ncbi:MAG: phosphate signaling complex protein PhoU [Gammaproteobacteria bacterium]|nr:phosphate signaling complex protein PhoU [Gammaproteobacteria bacterium]